MSAWILVSLVALLSGAAVVAALFGDDSPLRHPGLRRSLDQPIRPDDLRAVSFSTRFRGYDPVQVDQWLTAAADAWEALAEVAGEELVSVAEEQLRLGMAPDEDGLRHGIAWLERSIALEDAEPRTRETPAPSASSADEPRDELPGSGEELEDGGSDRAGILDR